jgi:hypothetical protein
MLVYNTRKKITFLRKKNLNIMKKLYLIKKKALTAFVVILMGYMTRQVIVECFVVECQIKFAVARGQIRYIQRFQVSFQHFLLHDIRKSKKRS